MELVLSEMGLLVLGSGVVSSITSLLVSRRIKPLAEVEPDPASETAKLRRRTAQLMALYNVFSEITETLEIRYVINSTLRETIRLMNADMAVLRSLKGEELVPIGALASTGQAIQHIRPVTVGHGPTGRAAHTGRTVRIDQDGERAMGPANADNRGPTSPAAQTGRAPMESGMIVPLIVGARVVGTLSCWSQEKNHFSVDDEQIMEMMASQVATAMVAAESVADSERRALVDVLTGLPNRLQFNDDLHGPLVTLAASGRSSLVAMADIDHFKQFNDIYGHLMGDVALQKVASVLRETIRDGDYVYRYGGEEFVLIFANAGLDQAEMLGERVREAVRATPFLDDAAREVGPITISIGIGALPDHAETVSDVLELADAAMYHAKNDGRNRVVVWDEEGSVKEIAA